MRFESKQVIDVYKKELNTYSSNIKISNYSQFHFVIQSASPGQFTLEYRDHQNNTLETVDTVLSNDEVKVMSGIVKGTNLVVTVTLDNLAVTSISLILHKNVQ